MQFFSELVNKLTLEFEDNDKVRVIYPHSFCTEHLKTTRQLFPSKSEKKISTFCWQTLVWTVRNPFYIDLTFVFQYVESVSGSIQKSIEEAQEKLNREREEKFFQDVGIKIFFLFIYLFTILLSKYSA